MLHGSLLLHPPVNPLHELHTPPQMLAVELMDLIVQSLIAFRDASSGYLRHL